MQIRSPLQSVSFAQAAGVGVVGWACWLSAQARTITNVKAAADASVAAQMCIQARVMM
jgi:hypothetical protein